MFPRNSLFVRFLYVVGRQSIWLSTALVSAVVKNTRMNTVSRPQLLEGPDGLWRVLSPMQKLGFNQATTDHTADWKSTHINSNNVGLWLLLMSAV